MDETHGDRDSAAPIHSPIAVDTLCLRGLNIQWPFSQLILMGLQTEEVRRFSFVHRGVFHAREELWIIETPSSKCASSTIKAIGGDLDIARRPTAAQIVGTVRFDSVYQHDVNSFRETRHRHCVVEGSNYDWNGEGVRFGWRVSSVLSLIHI